MDDAFRDEVVRLLGKAVKLSADEIARLIETPQQDFGDYAFPCFVLAKSMRKPPQEIAREVAGKIRAAGAIAKIAANGPYVNFFVSPSASAGSAIAAVSRQKENYGRSKSSGKTVMVEFFDANTHKAVHIGHIRNVCLGEALCRILEFVGNKVIRVNYQGDIGPHVARCLWGLMNLNIAPEANRLRYYGKVYAAASKKIDGSEKLEAEARGILLKIYSGDKKLNALWKKTRKDCLDQFDGMYRDFGVKYDNFYFESGMEFPAREISRQLVKAGIAVESDGAIIMDLKPYNLGVFVLLTKDGTALYSSKDIALAKEKMLQYRLDKSIHVVGKEQELHFKQLFKTLELIGHKDFAEKSYHLIYGLVMLPHGKMSSRAGSVVYYDDLRDELLELSMKEVKKRHKDWSKAQIGQTAKSIAFAALKLGMVYRDNEKELVFDWEHAINFEGETGPYVQYAHARICSILARHGKKVPAAANFDLLKEKEERLLIRLLSQFPSVVQDAARNYKPILVARYLLDLSQAFNNYYHQHAVLTAEKETKKARLSLIAAVQQVLKNGLNLLAIDAPQKM
ncbi:arginine--tRNA ligase [Candidatus Woesearchaeota archaeon]|nr:arginine--tRNA ligase [Candidatus Woesearchaeota archaeon]